ncbi:hypothetical protein AMK06_CH01816 [Rhizobium sp. N541]|uniref:hypothetical protein n=1 Tax=unclassified Rhizobium TaxID=2613769 RepID=UPI0007EE893E|nr:MULTISPECIES: hypothetical protein [unclassified Rhizobium]ANM16725.1 hypothetical protein AMK06_CH01816 [Rhizobium sp. N541]ANM23110.1 hypothetical protein AMK07_CH01813 [Rhizobium sp. N941]
MSERDLGRLIDNACSLRGAFVFESEQSVTVSQLRSEDTRAVAKLCEQLSWHFNISDEEGTPWPLNEIEEELAPFRVVVSKPVLDGGMLPVISAHGFRELLADPGIAHRRWWVANLSAPVRTWSTNFLPWGKLEPEPKAIATKNPRFLVKEYTTQRMVPKEVGRWLLLAPEVDRGVADELRIYWAEAATQALLACLPNEIDSETCALKFRGPPRLRLAKPSQAEVRRFAVGQGFDALQLAMTWVFENERDTEGRHALLASEIARSGLDDKIATEALEHDIAAALEGARIAYEMSLAATGADTLKALSDLRKAVTEETAKVIEATRQTVAAVSSALAVGIGLVAAKVTSTVSMVLIGALMAVAIIYVSMVAASGWQFVVLQREARKSWQHRLYRFLPKDEYKSLVIDPTFRAERAFRIAAILGLAAVLLLSTVLLVVGRP